jgi:hypothetical protein
MRKLFAGAAFAAIMALAGQASAAGPNIVKNPGFDLNTPPAGTAPLDWTLNNAASGSDFFVGPGPTFGAFSPPNSANFGAVGSEDDILSQILFTVPGDTYTISFELAHDSTNAQNDFNAWWGTTNLLDLVNASSFGYTMYTFTEVGTPGPFTVLSFHGREVPAWYSLDNVSVTSNVPEASTWAMMVLGFAGLGFAGFRARRTAIAAI